MDPEEAETEARQKPRRKHKHSKREAREQLETLEPVLQPLEATPSEVLMVEVDNVAHEDFEMTEEVKVSDWGHPCGRRSQEGLQLGSREGQRRFLWTLNVFPPPRCVSAGSHGRDRQDYPGHHCLESPLQVCSLPSMLSVLCVVGGISLVK